MARAAARESQCRLCLKVYHDARSLTNMEGQPGLAPGSPSQPAAPFQTIGASGSSNDDDPNDTGATVVAGETARGGEVTTNCERAPTDRRDQRLAHWNSGGDARAAPAAPLRPQPQGRTHPRQPGQAL